MKRFDQRFGADFLATLPECPGVYSIFSADGELIYVGKSRNLRRRLRQYRNAKRLKRHRKMRTIVAQGVRIAFEPFSTDLQASLRENELIQTYRPRLNLAGAFSFLYPFVGLKFEAKQAYFVLTRSIAAGDGFNYFGAFRSREICAEAFFSLRRLLRFVAHPIALRRPKSRDGGRGAYLFGYRQFPPDLYDCWPSFFRGDSPQALERLVLKLLERPAARARGSVVQEGLRSLKRFYKHEACKLSEAIRATGFQEYPVKQIDRDPLFLRFRGNSIASKSREIF